MAEWPASIVSLFDLVDIKQLILREDSSASGTMRNFHQFVQQETLFRIPLHEKVYTWNDSVLLLAFTNGAHSRFEPIMKELDDLKKRIDEQWRSYAISVEGIAFPPPPAQEGTEGKFVYLQASSYAFTNCFAIEEIVRQKEYRKSWYVDSRITDHINTAARYERIMVKMQPTGRKRYVYMYNGYLWSSSHPASPRGHADVRR